MFDVASEGKVEMEAKKQMSFIDHRQNSFASDFEQRRKSPVTKIFLDSSPKAAG